MSNVFSTFFEIACAIGLGFFLGFGLPFYLLLRFSKKEKEKRNKVKEIKHA